ncbi:MAG TPA: hypothetical protein VKN74_01810 [Candidatus Mcinerneyibacterium sp.]|nr:hypothetical protein [Candidatus Mcinerneyibacterium sp.]
MGTIIYTSGILAFISLLLTGFLGMKWKFIDVRLRIKLHKIFATLTGIFALIHVGIIFYLKLLY